MNIILLGAQASGKGTQAELLTRVLGIPHISSGDLFREEIEKQSVIGRKVKQCIERGELVPDDLTVTMISHRLQHADCAPGALLDGFPRTLAQARAFDDDLRACRKQVDIVLSLEVSREELYLRIAGRLICKAHQHIYNMHTRPPKIPGICDWDGSKLFQRPDDRKETVERRLDAFFKQTTLVLAYYRTQTKVVAINGEQDIERVHQAIMYAIYRQQQDKLHCSTAGL